MSKLFRTTHAAKLDTSCFREIRIRQASGAYRIIYLTTIGDVVHVLHAFQKKTQATAKRDIELAKARLRQIR
jgi:phage-related protein